MEEQYLIVSTQILPDYFMKVIQARRLVESKQVRGVSEAIQQVKISRSTYYKYKDHLFSIGEQSKERKAVLTLLLNHQEGILSEVLNHLAKQHANILTINQSIPIHSMASVNLSLDIFELDGSLNELIESLCKLEGVSSIKLIAME